MNKKILAVLTAGVLALTLAGCGSGGSPERDAKAGGNSSNLYERSITLTDGRDVTCVVWNAGNQGGVSCDWDGAK